MAFSEFFTGVVAYLLPIVLSFVLALVCSVIAAHGFPSGRIFMLVFAVAVSVCIETGALPSLALVFVALPVGVIWFAGDRI